MRDSRTGTNRETLTGLVDAPEDLDSVASNMGIDLSAGGVPHKREFSKVLMAWNGPRCKSKSRRALKLCRNNTVSPFGCDLKTGRR